MRKERVISLVAIVAISVCGFSRIAAAQDAQNMREPGGAATIAVTATATVKAIDPEKRIVTLQLSDGTEEQVTCGPEVRNFDQIKVGDEVKAAAVARMVVSIGKGGAAAAPADSGPIIARAPKGAKPGAIIAKTEQITAKVDAVDQDKRTVTLSGIGDKPQTAQVAEDVDLSNVKAGDSVSIEVTKGVALWVEHPSEAQPAAERLQPGEEGALSLEGATKTAMVESIDPGTRTITLRALDGQMRSIQLGKECVNFDQIKVGDQVRATIADEIAISVTKGGAAPSADAESRIALAPKGAKPGILVAETDDVRGQIKSIDSDKGTITLSLPDGGTRTVKAGPNVKLSELSAGDDVSARVTQAMAIVVEQP
jgi:hypothetical protein